MPEKCVIYEVKYSMFEAIYIGNNHQTSKKIMDSHFSNLLRFLKNGQKSDSFPAHFEHHFNYNTSRTYLRKYMTSKVENQLKPIGAMKTFTRHNCNFLWRNV